MSERITLSAGDWIKLSDIPNEQVFNLVKQCFTNAGFNDCNGKYSQWENAEGYKNLGAGLSEWNLDLVEFTSGAYTRQLSLSDIFNSVNGGMDWQGCNYLHLFDDGAVRFTFADKYSNNPIKRIQEAPEATISPNTSQWWDYESGCAVGLPEKGELVLQNGKEYEVLRSTVNNTNDNIVLLCLNINQPNTSSNIFWVNVRDIKPLDYKSPKQILLDKALDLAAQNMSFEVFIERLYEADLLKGGE